MNNIKFYIIILMIISSCAIQQPPTGGPPDKTPPIITVTFPANQTLNYKKDYVQFRFTKYMNKTSVIENLFISPNKKIDYDWSGKDLEISFKEPMDTNTTYSVTLGTDYTDLKGNKPEKSYSLIFSTGNKIDSGKIKGYVLNKKSEGIYVFAYYLNHINPDTLNPAKTKADYKTQVGSKGTFEIVALKPGKYRLFAVNDVYKDGLIDEGVDNFGSALSDVELNIMPVEDVKLKSGPPVELTGPVLYSAQALSSRQIELEFSKSLDTSSINRNNFSIYDSLKRVVQVESAFLVNGFANRVYLFAANNLDTFTKWYVRCKKDEQNGVRDSLGNITADSSSMARFYGTSETGSRENKIIAATFKDSATNISINGRIDLIFSKSISEILDSSNIRLFQLPEMKIVQVSIKNPQENILGILPLEKLASDSWFKVEFNSKGKTSDSTYKLTFKTQDIRNNGSLAGKIIDTTGYGGQYIITLYANETTGKYTIITKKTEFIFESLVPGSYTLEISSDANSNGRYDFGSAHPWVPAEKILVVPKEIIIKPRWKIEDYVIKYDGK